MGHVTDLTYVDDEKRVALYRRTDSKSGVWQAKFRIKGQRKYKRSSTGFIDFSDAKKWALREFMRLEVKLDDYDEALIGYGFKELATRWLEIRRKELERGEISIGTLQRDEGTCRRYLIPFFKSKKVGHIRQADLDSYREWRENYWTTGAGKNKAHKTARTPKTNTIRQENIALRGILRRAAELGQLRWDIFQQLTWRGESAGKERREHFSEADWNKLLGYMRRKDWLEHKHPRIRYDRLMLRDYIMIMKNTGMRVGEQRDLRWGDLEQRKDKDDNTYWVCLVKGKTGKRAVVCNDGTEVYFERLKKLTGKSAKTEWLWARQDGTQKRDFGNGFKALIRAAFSKDDERTLYSLRHTYATLKITKENMNLKILAAQMGTMGS